MTDTTDTTYTIEIKRLSTGDYQLANVKIDDIDKTQDYKETFDKVLTELGLSQTKGVKIDSNTAQNKDADEVKGFTDISGNDLNGLSKGGRKYSKRNRKVSRKSLKKSSK